VLQVYCTHKGAFSVALSLLSIVLLHFAMKRSVFVNVLVFMGLVALIFYINTGLANSCSRLLRSL
jgi:hypothetical protein